MSRYKKTAFVFFERHINIFFPPSKDWFICREEVTLLNGSSCLIKRITLTKLVRKNGYGIKRKAFLKSWNRGDSLRRNIYSCPLINRSPWHLEWFAQDSKTDIKTDFLIATSVLFPQYHSAEMNYLILKANFALKSFHSMINIWLFLNLWDNYKVGS